MPAATTHPSSDAIIAFANGHLADAESAEVEAHVAECDSCLRKLEQQGEHPLAGLVRGSNRPAAPQKTTCDTVTVCREGTIPDQQPVVPEVPAELVDHPRYRVLKVLGQG